MEHSYAEEARAKQLQSCPIREHIYPNVSNEHEDPMLCAKKMLGMQKHPTIVEAKYGAGLQALTLTT